MLWVIFLIACLALYWIYDGYGRFLQCAVFVQRLFRRRAPSDSSELPSLPTLTVLLTVHNEEDVVAARIENLLQCRYPEDRCVIMVASDGSTDRTNEIVESFEDSRVRLFHGTGQGKTSTQNAAIEHIDSDVIVFTDADVVFNTEYLEETAAGFQNPQVGAVAGRLLCSGDPTDPSDVSQGYYWDYELKLRSLESQLGWLAVVAGACFAIRRELLLPMDPAIGDDCIVPLDVVAQGFRVIHAENARCVDRFESGTGVTIRRRIRMTLRNWQGTWSRPRLLNPFRHPCYALALWSHKLLRWMSPVFLIVATTTAICLVATQPNLLTTAAVLPFAALFMMGALGAIGRRVPGSGVAFTFLIANYAFLVGVVRAMVGKQVFSYRNT